MLSCLDHPNVTLSDWQTFRKDFSRFVIDEVIERSGCGVPDWFLPLARGAAIASDTLLHQAGYRHGMRRPLGWIEPSPNYFVRIKDHLAPNCSLMVRECEDTSLWTIERLNEVRCSEDVDEILVHLFGSTPIFTRNYQSAMRLAIHSHVNDPFHGLRWIKAIPINRDVAIEIARQRHEASAATGMRPSALSAIGRIGRRCTGVLSLCRLTR
jgi:hypothetical protein